MLEASENLEFEKAAKLRDRIQAVEKTSQKQHVVSLKYKNQDIFGIASLNAKSCLSVLRFRNGDLVDTDTFVFDRIENIEDEYTEIIANFYAEGLRTRLARRHPLHRSRNDSPAGLRLCRYISA